MGRCHDNNSGFTLVEVMAALLIFSTAVLGLMHAGTENIRAVQAIEQKHVAGIIADNQLILALTSSEPARLETTRGDVEMAGQEWQWEISREATELAGFTRLIVNVNVQGSDHITLSRTAFSKTSVEALQ